MFQPEAQNRLHLFVSENATQFQVLVAGTNATQEWFDHWSSALIIPKVCGVLWFLAWLVGFYIFRRFVDNRNSARWGVIVQQDNPPNAKYGYIITVVCGHLTGGRSTSHVGIRVHGDNYSSLARLLSYPHRYLDQRDDWFLIITRKQLGNLSKLEIWHDCTGSKPYMYLRNVVIRDLENGYRWVFPAYQWLSLDHGTRRAYAELTPAHRTRRNLFFDQLADGLQNHSTWLNLLKTHPRSTYTSSQRFSVAMASQFIALTITLTQTFHSAYQTEKYESRDLVIVVNFNMFQSLWLSVIVVAVSVILSQLFRVSRKDGTLIDTRSQEELEEAAFSMRGVSWFGLRKGQCRGKECAGNLKDLEGGGAKKKNKEVETPAVGRKVERLLHMIDAAQNVRLANVFARTRELRKKANEANLTEQKLSKRSQDLESQTGSATDSGSVSNSGAYSPADSRLASGTTSGTASGTASGIASGALSKTVSLPEIQSAKDDKLAKKAAFLVSNAYIELVQKDIKRLISTYNDPEDFVMYPKAGYMLKDSNLQVVIRTQTGKNRGAVVTLRRPTDLFSDQNEKSKGKRSGQNQFESGTQGHIMSIMMTLCEQYLSRTPPKHYDSWPEVRVMFAWFFCLLLIGLGLYHSLFTSLHGDWVVILCFVGDNLICWIVAALIVSPLYESLRAFIMGYIFMKPSGFDKKRGRGMAPVCFPKMWTVLRREPRGASATMYRPLNKQESAILLVVRRHRIVFMGMLYDVCLWTAWIIVLLIIILSVTKENFYFFTSHMKEIFVTASETRTQDAINIVDFRQHLDLIEYMNSTFTFWSTKYSDPVDLPNTAVNLMLDQQNYLIGTPNVRQLRVIPVHCKAPIEFRPRYCYPRYGLSNFDWRDYGENWGPYPGPPVTPWDKIWTYTEAQGIIAFYQTDRKLDFYPGGGYVFSMTQEHSVDVPMIERIRNSKWLDYQTRLVVFSLTLYSPAFQSFIDLRVCIRQSRFGGFRNCLEVDIVRPPSTLYTFEDAIVVVSFWIIISLGFIMLHRFFYLPKLISTQNISVKILNYLILFFSISSLLNLFIGGNLYNYYLAESRLYDPLFGDAFSSIGWLSTAQGTVVTGLLIISTIRCAYAFKYFALFKVILTTLSFAFKPVLGMLLLLSIALLQFGMSLAMLMGHVSADFNSPSTSIWWLVAFIVDSNNNYDEFYEFHFYYSVPVQVVRWIMIIFIYFFFVNFMLAILTTMFHLALQAVLETERTELTVSAYMRGKFRHFFRMQHVSLHEEARQIALNKLTKMIVRERPLTARFPGVDTVPVSLSGLHAVDTVVDRFGNHHVWRPQQHLDHVMATIIRNKTVSDQPYSADDTVNLIRVYSVDGPKLVSEERLALVARRLNIRQAEPIPPLTEIRTELTDEVVDNIRSLVLDDCGEMTVQSKKAMYTKNGEDNKSGSEIFETPYFNAFMSYFPSVNVRLKERAQVEEVPVRRNEGRNPTDNGVVPRAELILSPKLIHLHLSKKGLKESGTSTHRKVNSQCEMRRQYQKGQRIISHFRQKTAIQKKEENC